MCKLVLEMEIANALEVRDFKNPFPLGRGQGVGLNLNYRNFVKARLYRLFLTILKLKINPISPYPKIFNLTLNPFPERKGL
jgi:hypothetical protein